MRIQSKRQCPYLRCKFFLNGTVRCHRFDLPEFCLDWFYEKSKPYLFTSLWYRLSSAWSLLRWRRFRSIWPVWLVLLSPLLDSLCKIFIQKKYDRWSFSTEWDHRSRFLFFSLWKISRFIILSYSLYLQKYLVAYSSPSGSSMTAFRSTPIRNTWVGDDSCEDRSRISSLPLYLL